MERISIRAFRAIDDTPTCLEFARQHARVLLDIGVANVVKPDEDWYHDPDSTVFVAEHDELGLVGGFRLQMDKEGKPLPMQRALGSVDPRMLDLLAEMRTHGSAEMTALWNAHRFAGRGVPLLLMSAMIATASQLPLRHLSILSAEYMGMYAKRNGCRMMESLGDGGSFTYPIAGIRSYAMNIPDLDVLATAQLEDRHRIVSLRVRPEQIRFEQPRSTKLEVNYSLIVDKAASKDRYMRVVGDRCKYAA